MYIYIYVLICIHVQVCVYRRDPSWGVLTLRALWIYTRPPSIML